MPQEEFHSSIRKKIFLLITVLMGFLFVSLGSWQLSRAKVKRYLLTQQSINEKLEPATENDLVGDSTQNKQDLFFRKVNLNGTFHLKSVFILDNRFYQHRLGYQVYIPFKTSQFNLWILVDLGWCPRETDFQRVLVSNHTILKRRKISGILYQPEKARWFLGNVSYSTPNSWPRVIQRLEKKWLEEQIGERLYPWVLVLDRESTSVLQYNWHPINVNPSKNVMYAVQWFLLTGICSVGFWLFFREKRI